MYKTRKWTKTSIKHNDGYLGERIEVKVARMFNNKEPITDAAPLIYQERGEGVLPAYDIRTDKFDVALRAMQYVAESHVAKRKLRVEKGGEDGGEKVSGETVTPPASNAATS